MLLARVQAQGKNKNVIRNTGSKLMNILLHLVMKTLLKRQINLESMFRRRTHLEIVFIKTSPILITLNRKHCLPIKPLNSENCLCSKYVFCRECYIYVLGILAKRNFKVYESK